MSKYAMINRLGVVVGAALLAVVASLALTVAPAMAEFGVQKFAVSANNENGTKDVQAGSHPYSLTTTFVLDPMQGDLKNTTVELPPGFIGNPDATPKCAYQEFIKQEKSEPSCSSDTAVGIATLYLSEASNKETEVIPYSIPIYNLVPPKGVAAEFGFVAANLVPVLLTTSVRTGGDYGLTTSVSNVNQSALVLASKVTIWGVPANPKHDLIRGECEREVGGSLMPTYEAGFGLNGSETEIEGPVYPYEGSPSSPLGGGPLGGTPEPTLESEASGGCKTQGPEIPLLTNPTSCGVPRTATLTVESWEERRSHSTSFAMPEITGCEDLGFHPTVSVTPEKSSGSTPSGIGVDVNVPQGALENPDGLPQADVRDTTVKFPAGVQVNPSSGDGLQACSEAQVGYTGSKALNSVGEPGVLTSQFTPYVPGSAAAQAAVAEGKAPASEGSLQPGVNFCPEASKIANVRIKTPLLEGELEGGMYLASPQNFEGLPEENPFSSLIALYLVAEEPKAGVVVKLPGKVSLDEETGQVTTSFDQTPALPFSDLHVELFGGDRAPLSTPALCGEYVTGASLTPWSSSSPVEVSTGSGFKVTSGPGGGSCSSNPRPFSPSMTTSTSNLSAGAFTSLQTTINREDGQQSLSGAALTLPPGVSAVLAGVPLCPEAQANAGTCSTQSQIGEAMASAGLGPDPYTVTGGKVYLTQGYGGAPFGLSIVTPAVAGPFNLGNVVVRAKIEVNPLTAAVSVVTTGEIPHILRGIPLQLRHVRVVVNGGPDHANAFAFNSTSCESAKVMGTVSGVEGARSEVSSPLSVGDCASLKYEPKVTVATDAHTSKADGASLDFRISYPEGAMGRDAWFAKVKLDIPKQLPARLTTLQKACTEKQFETNYAGCPSASNIGHAVVHTEELPVPLEGPVYFVSHGGAKFPEVVMVLQGDNVTIDLHGETFISKTGVTSATFNAVPDAPFESVEVNIPTGPYSEFTANGNVCAETKAVTVKKKVTVKTHGHTKTVTRKIVESQPESLVMPTALVAQNGAEIHQSTPIEVTGCPKAKPAKKSKGKKGKPDKKK
jgi:hypothetical protein